MEEKNNEEAVRELFERIKKTTQAFNDKYNGNIVFEDDKLVAESVIHADFDIRLRVLFLKEQELIAINSALGFNVPGEKSEAFAKWLVKYNFDTFFHGVYDYGMDRGTAVFRVSIPCPGLKFDEDDLTRELDYVLRVVHTTAPKLYKASEEAEEEEYEEDDGEDVSNQTSYVDGSPLKTAEKLIEEINSLEGAAQFKKMCNRIYKVAPVIRNNGAMKSIEFQNFLLSIDNGYGLSAQIDYLSDLLRALDLFTINVNHSHIEIKLTRETTPTTRTIDEMIAYLRTADYTNSLLCIDISDFTSNAGKIELKRLLAELPSYQSDYVFVFRVPYLEPAVLEDIRKTLADVLFISTVATPPFTMEELKGIAKYTLKCSGYELSDDAWKIFESRIGEEKSDGKFWGIRSVNNVCYEMMWMKCEMLSTYDGEDYEAEGVNPKLIDARDIEGLSKTFGKHVDNGFDELNDMVGMEAISERIREIVSQVALAVKSSSAERPCIHMRFAGSPGTGKTTVARILGRIFRENGILRNGYFFEYTARDLVGAYVGQTAPKTAAICRDAYGSVLFIDEAYALYSGTEDSKDYGSEALTTLIAEMENHRDDMVVIMAGYTDEMAELMKGNTGLRSRMPYLIEFPNYTKEQLTQIYMKFARKNFACSPDLEGEVSKYFASLSDAYLKSKEFANARFARNLYERTWSKAALRCSLNGFEEITLTREDFICASNEKEFSEKLMQTRTIGFN
ncbi:MAG: AAA family ATPase [Lachnospiraceae bacterium]|nr:AAA family ATPase [Lachnospiraceae bacterium]